VPIRNWTPERRARQRLTQRNWYLEHTEKVKAEKKSRILTLRKWLETYKSHLKCRQCGESRLPTLDFHHRSPDEKDSSVSEAVHNGWSIEHTLREIEKCEVLCANCHRKLHRTQRT
jgi:predicted HNH restriction endonuclease